MATKDEISKALLLLAGAYPNFALPNESISIYQRLLADMDFDLLKAATIHCASMLKFFPTVAEIRSTAVELKSSAEGIPSPDEAWGTVLEEIRNVGHLKAPTFKHEFIASVVQRFGWRNLCMSENATADRARFIDAYSNMVKDHKVQMQMLPEVRKLVQRSVSHLPNQIKDLANKLEG
jgi:hypothetical protein